MPDPVFDDQGRNIAALQAMGQQPVLTNGGMDAGGNPVGSSASAAATTPLAGGAWSGPMTSPGINPGLSNDQNTNLSNQMSSTNDLFKAIAIQNAATGNGSATDNWLAQSMGHSTPSTSQVPGIADSWNGGNGVSASGGIPAPTSNYLHPSANGAWSFGTGANGLPTWAEAQKNPNLVGQALNTPGMKTQDLQYLAGLGVGLDPSNPQWKQTQDRLGAFNTQYGNQDPMTWKPPPPQTQPGVGPGGNTQVQNPQLQPHGPGLTNDDGRPAIDPGQRSGGAWSQQAGPVQRRQPGGMYGSQTQRGYGQPPPGYGYIQPAYQGNVFGSQGINNSAYYGGYVIPGMQGVPPYNAANGGYGSGSGYGTYGRNSPTNYGTGQYAPNQNSGAFGSNMGGFQMNGPGPTDQGYGQYQQSYESQGPNFFQ